MLIVGVFLISKFKIFLSIAEGCKGWQVGTPIHYSSHAILDLWIHSKNNVSATKTSIFNYSLTLNNWVFTLGLSSQRYSSSQNGAVYKK
jgi:hypothetical protein